GHLTEALKYYKKFPTVYGCSTLITSYGYKQRKDIQTAKEVFRIMKQKDPKLDVFCWAAIINAYAHHQMIEEAKNHFEEMILCGIKPDAKLITCYLFALSKAKRKVEAIKLYNEMQTKYMVKPNAHHATNLLWSFDP